MANQQTTIDPTVEALRTAGLIEPPSPDLLAQADQPAMTIEQMAERLKDGPSLTQIIEEQRGRKA